MFQKHWYRIGKALVRFFTRWMLHVDIAWQAPLPEGPFILAANHPSTIDPAILTMLCPDQVSILIREALFKVPLFGRSLRLSGHIPVIGGCGQQALDEARRLLEAGRVVAIFPEGSISPTEGGFHRAHSGVARLALSTGVPVVPIGIHLDRSQLQFIQTCVDGETETGAWYFRGPYALTVGPAVRYQGDADNRTVVKEISEQIMRRVSHLAAQSALRIRTTGLPACPSTSAAVWKIPLIFFLSAVNFVRFD